MRKHTAQNTFYSSYLFLPVFALDLHRVCFVDDKLPPAVCLESDALPVAVHLEAELVGRRVHVADGNVEALVRRQAGQLGVAVVLPVAVVGEDVDGAVKVVFNLDDAAEGDVLAAVADRDLWKYEIRYCSCYKKKYRGKTVNSVLIALIFLSEIPYSFTYLADHSVQVSHFVSSERKGEEPGVCLADWQLENSPLPGHSESKTGLRLLSLLLKGTDVLGRG